MPDPISPTVTVLDWLIANRDQVLLGALIALGLVALMLVARAIGRWMVASEIEASHIGWKSVLGGVLARTTIAFMVIAAIDIVATYAAPPPRAQRLVDIAFIIAFALQGAIWARELILAIIARRVGDDPGATTLGNAMSLIRVLVSVALFALAIIVILDNLGVNVTALVAGLGIGGIAIGLAAQGIFSDLFAALAIVFDRPFRRGDTIRYGAAPGTTGRVERIGLKTTRIRALTGEQVIMANTKLLEQELTNIADTRTRRTWLLFGVTYNTAPDTIEGLPALMEEVLAPLKGCKMVRCIPRNFAPSSIDCELVYDDKSSDPDTNARNRATIMIGMLRAFADNDIGFAQPTQVAFTAAPDGSYVMPYPDETGQKPR